MKFPEVPGVTDRLPLVGSVPFQAPLAAQLVAPVEDHVSVKGWPMNTALSFAEMLTVGGAATVTLADPYFVVSSVEVAVIVAVPAEDGVKTPVELTPPLPEGLTDHVTDELKLPVPLTAEVQLEV